MKKLFAILLIFGVTASLFGCAQTRPVETAPVTELTEEVTDEPAVTQPGASEPTTAKGETEVQRISQMDWFENSIYGDLYQRKYRYDFSCHTLTISDGERKLEERTFFEGTGLTQFVCLFGDSETVCQQKEYDRQGHLLVDIEYEDGVETLKTVCEYREDGLLTRESVYRGQSEPDEVKVWNYDEAGQKIEYIEYEQGVRVNLDSWSYDAHGNVLKHDWEGVYGDEAYDNHEVFVYDEAGLLIESEHHGDDPVDCWDYRAVYTYDEAGRLIKTIFYHDDRGTVTDSWEYDAAGNLLKSVEYYYMDGWTSDTQVFTYNDAGQLTEVSLLKEYEYAEEPLYSYQTTYTYDEAGRLTEQSHSDSDGEATTTCYEYDAQGNRTLLTRSEDGMECYRLEYTYDAQGKLTRVHRNGEQILTAEAAGIRSVTAEDGREFLVSAAYETAWVSKAEADEIEAMNRYILQSLQDNG